MNGKCYTYPLILPDVHIDSPLATSLNCMEQALLYDDDFVDKCNTTTATAVAQHKQTSLLQLDEKLTL